MKIIFFTILIASSVFASTSAIGDVAEPEFSDYPVKLYSGTLKIPSYYKESSNGWRDDMGKLVQPPIINFAGKYYLGLHSCGTACRYYTLSNLENGADSNALDIFSNDNVDSKKTSDGLIYVASLISHPNSKMLVAQYHIENSSVAKEECHERSFVLTDDGQKIYPITKKIKFCREFK